MPTASRPGLGIDGRVHRWRRYDGISVRSLCEGVTAMRMVIQFKFDPDSPRCEVCWREVVNGCAK